VLIILPRSTFFQRKKLSRSGRSPFRKNWIPTH
jgi:hypothetical protein